MKRALMFLALFVPASALPCGGPDSAHLTQALEPAEVHVDSWLYQGEDGWDWSPAPVTRFLYAFPETDVDASAPGKAFHDALARGDLDAANRAANELVEAIMDLSTSDAESYTEDLRLAVEFIEVRPTLGRVPKEAVAAWFASTSAPTAGLPPALAAVAGVRSLGAEGKVGKIDPRHPRAASLRWLAVRDALKNDIPNGWTREEVFAAAPKGFSGLKGEVDAWLRDFPTHPLADYVRLKKLRLLYLEGDAEASWALLLEMYPRHPARVAAEMRFLTLQGVTSDKLDPLAIPLEVALGNAESRALTGPEWDVLWRKTEAGAGTPWALPAQERLLLLAYREAKGGRSLPSAFPAVPAAPTETWSKLRLAAVMSAGRLEDAEKQLALLPPEDAMVAPLRARLHLDRGEWVEAIRTPGIDPAAARYMIRIAAPESVATALVDDPDVQLRWEARMTLASRQFAATGDWNAGALLLEPVDVERAALWRVGGGLAKSGGRDALLAYARFLRSNGGRLFVGNDYDDVLFYRSLPDSQAPETVAWLTRSFSTWYALVAYAKWLDALDVAHLRGADLARARQVLAEADETYNTLLNYGSGDYYAWGAVLPTSDPAVTIRRVGKVLRAKAP